MQIRLAEHQSFYIYDLEPNVNTDYLNQTNYSIVEKFLNIETISSKPFNQSCFRYQFERKEVCFELKADYCIGVDWLGNTGKYIYVEPKINSKNTTHFIESLDTEPDKLLTGNSDKNQVYELDYLKMLLQVTSVSESNLQVKDLVQIDWYANQIPIEQKDDRLTPFLIIRFLQSLKDIVKKGLKKNYYKVQENLANRVKGKILVAQNIKQNVLKNKLTTTFCEYQVFGEDHLENRFLKKVLKYVTSYVENHKLLLHQHYNTINESINFCRPAFEFVSDQIQENELKHIKHNVFYMDYKTAIEMGNYILKHFAFNITKTVTDQVLTHPFWIDMPSLFELYVYSQLIEQNPLNKKEVHYQFSTYGNALDILISNEAHQMIIDTKYKLHYTIGHLHEDIRQVSGYARLNKVREKLKVYDDSNIDCLIIYPDMENGETDLSFENIRKKRQPIKAYYKVYKLGIKLPLITD